MPDPTTNPAAPDLVSPLTESGQLPHGGVAAIVPCKDEAARIAATVRALQSIAALDLVLVVDDGSTDDTSAVARAAGAVVVRHGTNAGKAAALTTGLQYLAALAADGRAPGPVLFVDGDLEGSAANLGVLVPPVLDGSADLAIATLPPQTTAGGGRGFVVRLAREGIARLTGWQAAQPLSGMRCLSPEAVTAATPLARGWGVEVGMTVDVLAAGLVVTEVPVELHHRVTGSDWRGQVHRAAQYRDVWLALQARRIGGSLAARRARRAPER